MYSEYNKAYFDMFKKSLISEADGDEELSLDDLDDIADDEPKEEKSEEKKTEPTEAKKEPPKVKEPVKEEKPASDVDMKFSVDLATEFSNTVNQFTSICAKIVETRTIDKDTSDKFYDLYSKIKCLADAASKTE